MALPQTIRVKLSSEAAESIAMTPVVVQEMPLRELIDVMLGIAGKDEARIREILLRGTMVSGASRFRWPGLAAEEEALRELLAGFPDPDPARAFVADRCVRVLFRGARQAVDVRREAGERKGLFQRQTFWDLLMDLIGAGELRYGGYSYRERADWFVRALDAGDGERLRAASEAVRYNTLREQVRTLPFSHAEVFVVR